jgi:hypothetical protein
VVNELQKMVQDLQAELKTNKQSSNAFKL